MKTKSFNLVANCILIFTIIVLLHSCETKIEIDRDAITVDCTSSTQYISFGCSDDWRCWSSNEKWLSCERTWGTAGNNKTLIINIKTNYDKNPRIGYVYLKSGNLTKTIVITQKKNDRGLIEIRNKEWNYSNYNSNKIPTCMKKNNAMYLFDFEKRIITYYEKNRRLREYIYDKKLEDPRFWNMATKDNGLVKEYKYTVEGVLCKAVYTYGKSSERYYAEVDIDATTGNEKENTWEIYEKHKGLFDDKVLDTKYDYEIFEGSSYTIYEIDKSTGTKKYLTKFGNCGNCVKSYVIDYLKKL